MQEYLLKNTFREKMDALGFHLLVFFLCCGWFLLLWGFRIQSILAGAGLYGLCLMLRHKTRDHRLAQKEQKLRQRIGGELLLEKLLFSPPAKAHFETALHFSLAEKISLERMTEQGVLCKKKGQLLLLSFVQLPAASSLTARDVLPLQRFALQEKADELWLCVPCRMQDDVHSQTEKQLPVRLIDREKLIRLFGAAAPATDRQLVELGKEKRKKASCKSVFRTVFRREKARRYALYGLLLLFLYMLTALPYYAVPGILCVLFATVSHCFYK